MLRVNCGFEQELRTAAAVLRNGGLAVYPTDTVYGLGCLPWLGEAVERVTRIKGRETKALPVLCSDMSAALKIGRLKGLALRLAERFWPGPLTIVVEEAAPLPDLVTDASGRVGVRMPNHVCALRLIGLCGGSLIGTSANKSGILSARTAQEAVAQLGDCFEVLVEGGRAPLGVESTVVDVREGVVRLLREGFVKRSQLSRTLRELGGVLED